MVAFILAGIVAVCTVLLALLAAFAGAMSDNPADNSDMSPVVTILGIGFGLAGLLAASHFLPHISW